MYNFNWCYQLKPLIQGTIIGTSRSVEFKEKSGRLKAAKNLIKFGINNLICIGGDGKITCIYLIVRFFF